MSILKFCIGKQLHEFMFLCIRCSVLGKMLFSLQISLFVPFCVAHLALTIMVIRL